MTLDITLFAEDIDNVRSAGENSLEITLSEVDINQLILEIGADVLLENMDYKEIEEYFAELEEETE